MYIHIGSGKVIRKKNIVGIFDLDTASHEKDTREFLKKAEKALHFQEKRVILRKDRIWNDRKAGNFPVFHFC